MQVNQQICRKMEDLDKMEEKSPHDSEVCNYISYVYILSFISVLQKIQKERKTGGKSKFNNQKRITKMFGVNKCNNEIINTFLCRG